MSVVDIGKILRELYLDTGLKMARFREHIAFSEKTIYYHFKQEHLNTSILDVYEKGLREMGKDIDLWELIAKRRRGERGEEDPAPVVADPATQYGVSETSSVAELLRRAANLLEGEKKDMPLPPKP